MHGKHLLDLLLRDVQADLREGHLHVVDRDFLRVVNVKQVEHAQKPVFLIQNTRIDSRRQKLGVVDLFVLHEIGRRDHRLDLLLRCLVIRHFESLLELLLINSATVIRVNLLEHFLDGRMLIFGHLLHDDVDRRPLQF